ncbi:MAG: fluoride efflux transporter CrcB [Ignavibacteria bacterium]|nr:fluoride efflux transporter CrcB [Ignavibacteria bacterium]
MTIIYIGIGGFIGAISRYLLSRWLNNFLPSFPLGTLTVNVIGSFILGFVMYSVTAGRNISPELRDFITIGILGGFTTMSSFAYESFRIAELNQVILFTLNIVLNVVLCIMAVYAGRELALIVTK